MPHAYGDTVTSDIDLPAYVLGDPRCPAPVREAFEAFEAANAATAAERDTVNVIADEMAENRAAIALAIRQGKKPPAPLSQEIADERTRQGEMKVRAAANRARAAAKAYEEVIPQHRAELRAIVAERLPELSAAAAKSFAAARAGAEALRAAAAVVQYIDRIGTYRRGAPVDHDTVDRLYADAARRDPFNAARRPERLALAWGDVEAYATGVPVDLIAPDPLNGRDLDPAQAPSPEAVAARAQAERAAFFREERAMGDRAARLES